MLLGRKDERTAKGAVMVLRSLTFKAREVFRQLADNQDSDDNKEQGLVPLGCRRLVDPANFSPAPAPSDPSLLQGLSLRKTSNIRC